MIIDALMIPFSDPFAPCGTELVNSGFSVAPGAIVPFNIFNTALTVCQVVPFNVPVIGKTYYLEQLVLPIGVNVTNFGPGGSVVGAQTPPATQFDLQLAMNWSQLFNEVFSYDLVFDPFQIPPGSPATGYVTDTIQIPIQQYFKQGDTFQLTGNARNPLSYPVGVNVQPGFAGPNGTTVANTKTYFVGG
jgi:hypothetical protein